jgi:hypothetical protein
MLLSFTAAPLPPSPGASPLPVLPPPLPPMITAEA